MISVDEAYRLITSHTKDFGVETIPFLQAVNRTLATDLIADRDFPPYDRVTMDGIAISSTSFASGRRRFLIEKTSPAGLPVQSLDDTENCIEVMTGAVLPIHADAVIPYEQCTIYEGIAEVKTEQIKANQNIHKKGTDEKAGAVLLEKNNRITPAHISVMATVGKDEVDVYKLPSVAVCSSGDELVAVTETPLPHQVRQSNVYFLAADLQKEKITASLHHLPDDKLTMKQQLQAVLQRNDVVLLSGAVSKGKWDYLPAVLEELGMNTIFYRIEQRPGKPFLFGSIADKMVFGFPGNPVSTFVCYHLYFKHWLQLSRHQSATKLEAKLAADVSVSASLTNHILVQMNYAGGCCFARPIISSNSGDIPALIHADGILSLPAGRSVFEKGEVFEVTLCR